MDEDIDNVGEEIQAQSETTAEFEISLATGNGVSTKGSTVEIPKNEDGSDKTEDANGNESSVVRCFRYSNALMVRFRRIANQSLLNGMKIVQIILLIKYGQ